MNDWQRSDTNEGNGYFWENEAEGVSAFEDTSEGASRFYAWIGTPDDHDDAGHSHTMPTLDEAIANLDAIISGAIEP
jgi:hypothetical protein